jgi:hypothetical protein
MGEHVSVSLGRASQTDNEHHWCIIATRLTACAAALGSQYSEQLLLLILFGLNKASFVGVL